MTNKKMPLGVSIIAILMIISAIVDIAAGVFMIIDKAGLATQTGLSDSAILGYGIGLLVLGLIVGLLAFGLRGGSNGVRLFIAVVIGFRVLVGLYALIAVSGLRFQGFAAAAIGVGILYLLYGTDDARDFFA